MQQPSLPEPRLDQVAAVEVAAEAEPEPEPEPEEGLFLALRE